MRHLMKGAKRSVRHGPSQAQIDCHQARQSYRKAIKRGFKSFRDQFLNMRYTSEAPLYCHVCRTRAIREVLVICTTSYRQKRDSHAKTGRLQGSIRQSPRGARGSQSQRRSCNPKHSSKRSFSPTMCSFAAAFAPACAAGFAASTQRLLQARSVAKQFRGKH